ncbi:hypothetical protein OJF2_09800 [Aquisphaera giovannonii]|uniref:Uncharacterized protein n=1 Tax=Aquisphaera giovannonii TaxID=406548 RepID=A0A5B9VVX6_9BACT|nr:hypothetical protein [Aquisphaera giovannonii]QEH32503.1 hypothetical protein OJF2_09800 [Aquisphaera giovannonii]
MAIPRDWLCHEIDAAAVEAGLVDDNAPELWLRTWWAMRDRMRPGDELWAYFREETAISVRPSPVEIAGFEQVLDGETLARLGLPGFEDEDEGFATNFRSGYAVVRDGEVVDSIEDP